MNQKKVVLILLTLLSIQFWGYVGFLKYLKFTNLIVLGTFIYFYYINFNNDKLVFKKAINLYLIGTIFNILSAFFNQGQNPIDSFLSFGIYYFILFYFVLNEMKLERKYIETLIIVFAFLYAYMYISAYVSFPNRLFSGVLMQERGTIRVRIQGHGFLILGYFLLLNRFLLEKKTLQILAAMFFFIILFKTGYRTILAGVVLMSGIMLFKMTKYSASNYFMIILAAVAFIGILQIGNNALILESMINATENQQAQGEDYIRHLQYDFFTKVYPKNITYYLFGGGFPGSKGAYAAYFNYLEESLGFYWVDIGIIGYYFVMGCVTLFGMLWWSFKAIFTKLSPRNTYISFFFGYLIVASIVTSEIYITGMLPVHAFALYLIDLDQAEKKKLNG